MILFISYVSKQKSAFIHEKSVDKTKKNVKSLKAISKTHLQIVTLEAFSWMKQTWKILIIMLTTANYYHLFIHLL